MAGRHRGQSVALSAVQEERSTARRLYASAETKRPVAELKTPPRRWRWLFLITGCAAALVLAVVARQFTKHEPVRVPQLKQHRLTSNSSENPLRGGGVISPDGRYLAYADRIGLHVKLLETGETHTIPEPAELRERGGVQWEMGNWFPTGTRFVANAHPPGQGGMQWRAETSSVWLVSLLGGAPRKLRDGARAGFVSPDGSRIAFFTRSGDLGEREIWVMEPNGEQAHKLLDAGEKASVCCLQWSARGQRAIYFKKDGSGDNLISHDLSGGPARTLVSFPRDRLKDYIWLPDGRVLYGLSEPGTPNDSCNLWQIRVDEQTGQISEEPRQITNWAGFCISTLSATADGRRLAFERFAKRSGVYVAGLESGGRRITNPSRLTLSDSFDLPLDWTADSKAVIILSDREGHWGAFKQARDADTAAEPVMLSSERVTNARVSPDGAWVLYGLLQKGSRSVTQLYRVPITGGQSELLYSAPIDDHFCAKAPAGGCVIGEPTLDGRQLVFSAFDVFKGRGRELARFNTDLNAGYISWSLSPDGKRLAIVETGDTQIHVISLDGQGQQSMIVKGWHRLRTVIWAADGQGFFISAEVQRAAVLLHVDREGNSQVVWKQDGSLGSYAVPSPDGRYLAIQSTTEDNNVWMLEDF